MEAGGREAFRLSGNVNFTPGYFLWDLFLGELETLPNYVWVSFKAHKLHPSASFLGMNCPCARRGLGERVRLY